MTQGADIIATIILNSRSQIDIKLKGLDSYLNNITRNLFINARLNNYLLELWVKYNLNKSR